MSTRSRLSLVTGLCLFLAACVSAPPTPTSTPVPTATPTATRTALPTATPSATLTPTSSATPSATPTHTASPTRTPRPTQTSVIVACPGAPPLTLGIGQTVSVGLEPPIPSRLREQPSRSATFLGQVNPGESVLVIGGPECAEGFAWWKVSTTKGLIGWTIEGDSAGYWLVTPTPVPQVTPPTRTPGPTGTPFPVSVVDGSGQIAFRSTRTGQSQIFLMNSDGTGLVNLSNSPSTHDSLPTWAPDGGRLAFVRQANGSSSVWRMNPDGSEQTQLYSGEGMIEKLAWSPDGGRLAFCTFINRGGVPESAVYVMGADGSGLTRLDASQLGSGQGDVDWSPDGGRIFFVGMVGNPDNLANYFDTTIDIYSAAPDGSGRTNLTSSIAPDLAPSLSPDGARFAFVRKDVLWVVSTSGGLQTPITVPDKHGVITSGPFVWIDNGQIIFHSTRGTLLQQVDGPVFSYVAIPEDLTPPSFSRDGSRLTFSAQDKVYVILTADLISRNAKAKLIAEQASQASWRP